jgi:hypothetical protein
VKSSAFKGVSWDEKTAKWRASGHAEGKKKTIGRFSSEVAAAKAYDTWAKEFDKDPNFRTFTDVAAALPAPTPAPAPARSTAPSSPVLQLTPFPRTGGHDAGRGSQPGRRAAARGGATGRRRRRLLRRRTV